MISDRLLSTCASAPFVFTFPCQSPCVQVRFIGSNHITSHELLSFNMVWLGLQVRHDGVGQHVTTHQGPTRACVLHVTAPH